MRQEDKGKTPSEEGHKVVYVGFEKNYFSNISYRLKTSYPEIEFNFIIMETSPEQKGGELFFDLTKIRPKIVYVDFCNYKREMLKLSEFISREPLFHDCPIVGLIDSKENSKSCLGAGVDFLYVKGGEFFDLIYAPMTMAFPKNVQKPDFAKGRISRDAELINDFRVGYIAPTYIHVEGDFFLEEGAEISFESEIPSKNIPSKNVKVKNRRTYNLYYDFNYSYDLDFVFVDKPELKKKGEDELLSASDEKERSSLLKKSKEQKQFLLEQYKDDMAQSQKKHRDWVVDNMDFNLEKRTKVLVIDEGLRIFSLAGACEEFHNYSFRCYTKFEDGFRNILRQRPSLVVYQLLSDIPEEDEEIFEKALEQIRDPNKFFEFPLQEEEEKFKSYVESIPERERQEVSRIGELIGTLKKEENFSPIIVLFNCYFQTSKSLQQTFLYPMILTYQNSLNMDVVTNLAGIYEKKQDEKMSKLIKDKILSLKKKDPQKYGRLNESDFKEKKYFIKKSNSLSYGSVRTKIHLILLTESEVQFQTKIELPMKTYRLDYPLSLSLHLVPLEPDLPYKEEKGLKTYRGIIHSISEVDKKNLRQVVNDIFFGPLNEKRKKEKIEYERLNQSVAHARTKLEMKKKKARDSAKERNTQVIVQGNEDLQEKKGDKEDSSTE